MEASYRWLGHCKWQKNLDIFNQTSVRLKILSARPVMMVFASLFQEFIWLCLYIALHLNDFGFPSHLLHHAPYLRSRKVAKKIKYFFATKVPRSIVGWNIGCYWNLRAMFGWLFDCLTIGQRGRTLMRNWVLRSEYSSRYSIELSMGDTLWRQGHWSFHNLPLLVGAIERPYVIVGLSSWEWLCA